MRLIALAIFVSVQREPIQRLAVYYERPVNNHCSMFPRPASMDTIQDLVLDIALNFCTARQIGNYMLVSKVLLYAKQASSQSLIHQFLFHLSKMKKGRSVTHHASLGLIIG